MKYSILSFVILISLHVFADRNTNTNTSGVAVERSIERIDPPHWWAGMQDKDLQLVVYGSNLAEAEVNASSPLVRVLKTHTVENSNYVFIDLQLAGGLRPGKVKLEFRWEDEQLDYTYEFKERSPAREMGLTPADLIYLIMPDRFANGEISNDNPPGMREKHEDRHPLMLRQGGDLQGIQQQLDYISDLGVTAIWLNPVLINDQEIASYHGYAATDLYLVDPRFGGNKAYRDFVDACHAKDIKVIKDIIHNHVGDMNWFIQDMPMKDWVHQWPEYTKTSYRATTLFDPHASKFDREIMTDGWFDTRMPDLNQSNPFVAKYLIQNNLWWIEEFSLDAFRMDTWAYSEPGFLKQWTAAILAEYPDFTIFGETWVHGSATQAYFHGNTIIDKAFDTGLPSLTDFQMHYAFEEALTKQQGWTEGVSRIYYTLAKDYIYENPEELVIFLDNHDKTRIWTTVGEDYDKFIMGIDLLMTMRGIPSLYYGTEILMGGSTHPTDALVRVPFPGGWRNHPQNKFTAEGRNERENATYDYVSGMAKWRAQHPAITSGKLMQFVPEDGLYCYFRYTEDSNGNANNRVLIAVNTSEEDLLINNKQMDEMLDGYYKGVHPVSGQSYELEKLIVPAGKSLVLELK